MIASRTRRTQNARSWPDISVGSFHGHPTVPGAEPLRFVPGASGLQAKPGRNVSTYARPAVFTGTGTSIGESGRLISLVVGHSARSRRSSSR